MGENATLFYLQTKKLLNEKRIKTEITFRNVVNKNIRSSVQCNTSIMIIDNHVFYEFNRK